MWVCIYSIFLRWVWMLEQYFTIEMPCVCYLKKIFLSKRKFCVFKIHAITNFVNMHNAFRPLLSSVKEKIERIIILKAALKSECSGFSCFESLHVKEIIVFIQIFSCFMLASTTKQIWLTKQSLALQVIS